MYIKEPMIIPESDIPQDNVFDVTVPQLQDNSSKVS